MKTTFFKKQLLFITMFFLFFSNATASILNVGTTLDLSRGAKQLGQSTKAGIELAIKTANNNNIVLSYYDDQYKIKIARDSFKKMLESNIPFILCPVGGEIIKQSVDIIENKNIMIVFPLPSITLPSGKYKKQCINFGPTYAEYAKIVTQHLASEITPKKIVILYQDDSSGNLLLKKSKEILEEANIRLVTLPFTSNNVSQILEHIKTTKIEKPDCIGIFGPPSVTKKFIKKCGPTFCSEITFMITALEDSSLIRFMTDQKLKFIGANVIPDPQSSSLPIMKEFCINAKENNVKIDMTSAQAYICTSIFTDVISKVSNPTPIASFNEFTKLNNYQFKGLELTYNPKTLTVSNKLWLHTINGSWEEKTQTNV